MVTVEFFMIFPLVSKKVAIWLTAGLETSEFTPPATFVSVPLSSFL